LLQLLLHFKSNKLLYKLLYTLRLRKVPTFQLSVTLSNLKEIFKVFA